VALGRPDHDAVGLDVVETLVAAQAAYQPS
jgi:hypothetical protein